MSTGLALYGTEEVEAPARRFVIGALSFDLAGGNLRDIRLGDVELVRAIAYLVRDSDWGTLTPEISDLTIDEGDGLRISYRASCRSPDGAQLRYVADIVVTPERLDFTVEAEAGEDFRTNRLGFCLLHPADLAGAPLRVEHGDGTSEQACFPRLIDPWQPFTDIRALAHSWQGASVECRFEGEVFEMEDQRNWSDASFKTYVRPLALPWPYVVPAGACDRQAVSLRIGGEPTGRARPEPEVRVEIGGETGPMPRIGLVISPDQALASASESEGLKACGVQDLLLSFDASAGQGEAEMKALGNAVAASRARRTLECVIPGRRDLDSELGEIARLIRTAGLALDAVAVFPRPDLKSTPPGSAWPTCPPLDDVYAAARRAFPDLLLGGGMFGYFTELNRKRAPAERLDFFTHATCPIVHAADDRSVMQSLSAVPHILRSARAIYPDLPYRLGPITIGMRQNPYGSRTLPNPDWRRVPMAMADPRQSGRFAAAWTIGYAAATEEAGLETLTLGALTGPLGIVGERGPRPVFDAVRLLAALAGRPRRRCIVSRPEEVAAIAAGNSLLLANLTAEARTVQAGSRHLSLEPFEVRRVRIERARARS